MKQIITVLAILISGIASAQSNWNVSVCDGELVHNYQRYDVIDNLLTENHQGNLPGGRSANTGGWFCLDDLITPTRNLRGGNNPDHHRYFVWYCNGTRRNNTGHEYTDNLATVRNYGFANGAVIRIYPDNYADGQNGRLGHRDTHASHAGKYEVRTFVGGRSALNEGLSRFHTSAQSAWNYANR